MVHIGFNRRSFALISVASVIWANNGFVAAQSQYPNPFAPSATPAPAVQPHDGSSAYPNPFKNNQTQPGAVDSDQSWADGICHSDPTYGAAYVGARDSNGVWACVLLPESNRPQPCFGEPYVDPRTGLQACRTKTTTNCPGSPSCGAGKTYQRADVSAPAGACCSAGNTFACSCKDGGSFVYDPLSCPVLHRNIRITPTGPRFNLFCNISTKRQEIFAEQAGSFIECVDACGALTGCAGVEFNRLSKQCSFKSEFLTEDSEGGANNDVDSASMDPPPQCPGADGQTLTVGGIEYELFCHHGWKVGLPTSHVTKAKDVYDCTRQCTEKGSSCQGANYWFANKDCVMTSAFEFPPTGGDAGNAVVGAIPKKQK
ncbi:hypothetical protein V502_02164, partial [Pseudogymnoascus sp. VKM F-4520 (FW-2644)]